MTQNQTIAENNESRDNIEQTRHLEEKINDFNKEKRFLTSVIIPVFNEEKTISNVIERIPNHHQYEIIIVDDGSTDNSVKKIIEIPNRDIKIIKHEQNQGYGAAILTGVNNATGDIIVTLDSDGQHNPEEIPHLLKPIISNRADVVIGSRYKGKCQYKMPLYTRVGEYFVHVFLKLLFLQTVYDNQCGFRAFRKELKSLLRNMRYTDMGFSTELLFKTAFYEYRIVEIPVSVNARKFGSSYVNLIRIVKSIFSCIIYYTLRKFHLDVNRLYLKRIVDYFYSRIKHKKIFK
jgi:glycosyltransferase involved in cell wall biosynthesis